MNRRALLLSGAVAISILIVGCSGGPGVSLAITTPPPANLPANLTASIAATVTNDPTNSGVDWGCTPVGACGTFNPVHTASGAMTVYTAPGAPGAVVITAASTKNPAVHQQAAVTIGAALTIQITTLPPANMTSAAPERIRAEFFAILALPRGARALRAMAADDHASTREARG